MSGSTNVVEFRRPTHSPVRPSELAFFIRASYQDQPALLDLMATGERGMFGLVIDAQNVERQEDLITEARRQGFDVVLDPKTLAQATPGGHSERLAALPWGNDEFHRLSDFSDGEGRAKVEQIVEFALEHQFTQLIGPTHLLSGPNDPWLRRDIALMEYARLTIATDGANLPLIYSLAVSIAVLRDPAQRQALFAAVRDIPCDAIWLKIENFGDDASGDKTVAYVQACRELHDLGLPMVADMTGGLPGLGLLAFGATGGIAHGVTMYQNFKASGLRRPPNPNANRPRLPARRVYLPQLDMLVKPSEATQLLEHSPRVRAMLACTDSTCCPHGHRDMTQQPWRHAICQRAREIERITRTPPSLRPSTFVDQVVRPISDGVARLAGLSTIDENLRQKLLKKQTRVSNFRHALAYLAESNPGASIAVPPRRRADQ